MPIDHGCKGPCAAPKTITRSPNCPGTGFDSNPYRWSAYALEKELSPGPDATRDDLLKAIDGSILASSALDIKYISSCKPSVK